MAKKSVDAALPEWKILVYALSKAEGPHRVKAALDCLREGIKTADYPHDFILWANSPDVWAASQFGWEGRRESVEGGANVGQHVALTRILEIARAGSYDFIVRIDDDVEWKTKRWLSKLLRVEHAIKVYSGKWAVLAPRVLGLINPVETVNIVMPDVVKGGDAKVYLGAAHTVGGVCRLHHISFFEDYVPDCRRALGGGDATTIAAHAQTTHIPIFVAFAVSIGHHTLAKEKADPATAALHGVLQRVPYIPIYMKEAGV